MNAIQKKHISSMTQVAVYKIPGGGDPDGIAGRGNRATCDLKYIFCRRRREHIKVSDLSLLVHCEVDLINGGHWEGAQVGALTRW